MNSLKANRQTLKTANRDRSYLILYFKRPPKKEGPTPKTLILLFSSKVLPLLVWDNYYPYFSLYIISFMSITTNLITVYFRTPT